MRTHCILRCHILNRSIRAVLVEDSQKLTRVVCNDRRHAVPKYTFVKFKVKSPIDQLDTPNGPLDVICLVDCSFWWNRDGQWTQMGEGEKIPFRNFKVSKWASRRENETLIFKIVNGKPSWISSSSIRSQNHRRRKKLGNLNNSFHEVDLATLLGAEYSISHPPDRPRAAPCTTQITSLGGGSPSPSCDGQILSFSLE